MSEHEFIRDSRDRCCIKCQACPTCEPDVVAAPCTESNGWIGTDRQPAADQPDGRLAPAVDPEHHAERYSPDVIADQSIGGGE